MPKLHRDTMNKIADATHDIIREAGKIVTGDAFEVFKREASAVMTMALTGESSSFDPGRFRERCLGLRRGR